MGVLCFTETWLDSEIEIENYVVTKEDRNRKGVGVCVYVRADVSFNYRSDLNHNEIVIVWLDILLPKQTKSCQGLL